MATLECFIFALVAIAWQVNVAAGDVTFPSTSPTTATVAENAADGATVVTVTASDSDVTYSLVSQDPDTNPKVFAIASDSGVVTVGNKTRLDFEKATSYTLEIKASDNPATVSATTTVTVTVTDVDGPPTFAETTYSACVNTSSPGETTVTQVTATDIDDDDTLTYAITGGNTGTVFIVSDAGIIKVANSKTVGDTPTSYNLTLVATDNGGTPLSGTATVSVTVEDPCPIPTTAAPKSSAMTAMISCRVVMLCVFVTIFYVLLFL